MNCLLAELENPAELRLSLQRTLVRAEQDRWDKEERRLTDSDDNNPVTQDKANLRRRNWLETGCERPWLQLMCCAVTPSGGLTSRQASEDELREGRGSAMKIRSSSEVLATRGSEACLYEGRM